MCTHILHTFMNTSMIETHEKIDQKTSFYFYPTRIQNSLTLTPAVTVTMQSFSKFK
jgi:hypothetical protein